ncbi:MAG: CSLREA domain-containing protein, partial [Chloroflexi bacterium]
MRAADVTLGAGIGNKAAQTVTARLSGKLTEVDLDVFCSGGAQLSIEVQGVSGGVPDGVMRSRLLVDGPINATGFHPFYFEDPSTVVAGAQFALVLGETTNSGTLTCSIRNGADGDGYGSGAGFWRETSDTAWRALATPVNTYFDWPFKTYVTSSTSADVGINGNGFVSTTSSTYTFSGSVVNFGPDDATGAYVTYIFSGPATIMGWNATQPGRCVVLDGGLRLNCPIAPFVAHGGYTNNVVVQRTGTGLITQHMQVWASEADPNGANNDSFLSASDTSDLIVTSFTAPRVVARGGSATFTYTIQNQGTTTATSAPLWADQVYLSLSPTSVTGAAGGGGFSALRSLGPGEQYTNTFTASVPDVPPGNYYYILYTDAGSQVAESNEGNNLSAPVPVAVATLVVNTISDHAPDGVCDSNDCTLREAIDAANAFAGAADVIGFNIASGSPVIQPTSPLPAITAPVIIDGTTQPGFAGTPKIEIDGTGAGSLTDGLVVQNSASGSLILSLVIRGFTRSAIRLYGDGVGIFGNYIGTDVTGALARPNATASGGGVYYAAIDMQTSGPTGGPSSTVIGGPTAGQRNVISGNAGYGIVTNNESNDNLIEGNYIGVTADGNGALGNAAPSVEVFGADDIIRRNVISATGQGVGIFVGATAAGQLIQRNHIGTNATGTAALPNNGAGISVRGTNVMIGGTNPADGNVIADNVGNGVLVILEGNRVSILGNAITANTGLGINLRPNSESLNIVTPNDAGDGDTGPNGLQNYPVLTQVTSTATETAISGTLNSLPSLSYRLQFFTNTSCDPSGNGEGEAFLGEASIATDASGNAIFTTTLGVATPLGRFVTATATDPTGNTSEFSACAASVTSGTSIAYVYTADTTARDEFVSFLSGRGFAVTPVTVAAAAGHDFSPYAAIVIAHDAGRTAGCPIPDPRVGCAWPGADAAIAAIRDSGKKIVGIGEGGSAFFGRIGLAIDWLHTWYANGTSVVVVDGSNPIWTTPTLVGCNPGVDICPPALETGSVVPLYTSSTQFLALSNPTPIAGVVRIGRQTDDTTHYPLVAQGSCATLWGFFGSPATMTTAAKDLFTNALVTPACA